MNILSINKVTKLIGDKTLFKNISFGMDSEDKVGIIGVNGSGKSTLIRLIQGIDQPDEGEFVKNKELKIGVLEQNPIYNPESTILEHIYSGNSPIIALIKKYTMICDMLNVDHSEEIHHQYEIISTEMDKLNAWEYESKSKSILNELGIKSLHQKMKELSGGMLKKVELVKTILDDTGLIILDEPTNHLDIDTILWLQDYLETTNRALILVTHDRYFLDIVVNKIYEIDKEQIYTFNGNYNYYLEKKVEIESNLQRVEAKAKSFLRTELDWLKRQPKARGTKQKARIDKIHSVINRPQFTKNADIEFSVSGRRLGKKILEIHNITKSFSNKLIDNFSYIFKHNERIGIAGPNGSGKSTLLNIITEKIQPDSGAVSPGINTKFGYFDQVGIELDLNMRVLEFIQKKAGEYIKVNETEKITAAKMLETFLFTSSMQSKQISKLSGGERRRLYLVYTLMQNPNFLILDEPTNDLDIKTLSVLEEFLDNFPGCVLVVSHDRYFMDRVVDSILTFEGNGIIKGFSGNYSEFLEFKRIQGLEEIKEEKKRKIELEKSNLESNDKKKGLSFKEKKEYDDLEIEIGRLEKEKSENTKIISSELDYSKLNEVSKKIEQIEFDLNKKMTRWEDLASKIS